MLQKYRTYKLFISVIGFALATSLFVACSGDDPAVDDYSLANVCDKWPAAICELRQPCCENALTFDFAGCEARERELCEANVAEVEAGTMAFDATQIDPCLTAQAPYMATCDTSAAELFDIIHKIRSCSLIFTGDRAAGDTCERNEQCALPEADSDAAGCYAGYCAVAQFLPEDATCTLDPASTAYCDYRLFCDADLTQNPPTGTCKPVANTGDSCAASPLSCGSQSYCDGTTQLCTALKNGGEACATAPECHSYDCNQTTNTCEPIRAFVNPTECTGAL